MKLFNNVLKRAKQATAKRLFILFALFLTLSAGGLVGVNAMSSSSRVDAATLDCSDSSGNSIIRNGANSRTAFIGDVKSSNQLQAVYKYFNLSSGDYQNFINHAKQGYAIRSNNTIVVDGKVVATDAGSIGNYKGCQGTNPKKFTIHGKTYWGNLNNRSIARSTSALPVEVLFNDKGQVQFAVMMNDCGNPMYFKPKTPPVCKELNAKDLGNNEFKLTTSVTNADYPVNKVVYTFSNGKQSITSRTAGNDFAVNTTISEDVTVTAHVYVDVPGVGLVVTSNCPKHLNFTPPPAVTACGLLEFTKGKVEADGSTVYTLKASKTVAQHATIKSYTFHFGDGSNAEVVKTNDKSASTKPHTYAPGTYTAEVSVTFVTDRGNTVTKGNSGDCKQQLTVKKVPVAFACKDLTLTPGDVNAQGNTTYTLTATATTNNATVNNFTFYPDDGSGPQVVRTHNNSAHITNVYKPGTYNNIHVVVNGVDIYHNQLTDGGGNCVQKLTVKPQNTNLTCVSLTATAGAVNQNDGSTSYTLTAVANPTRVTIDHFTFYPGDQTGKQVVTVNNGAKTANLTHKYAVGTWNAYVTVSGTDIYGHQFTDVTSDACKTQVNVNKLPTNLTCDSLTPNKLSTDATTGATTYNFTANATPTNATIDSYVFDFGNGSTQTLPSHAKSVTSQSQVYAARTAAYHVTVAVNGTDIYGHKFTAITSAACKTSFTVKTPECKPGVPVGSSLCSTLTCNSLTLTPGDVNADGSQSYVLNGSASADNAKITNFVFNFGDNSQPVTVPAPASNQTSYTVTVHTDSHSYAPGTYTASVAVNGTDVNGSPITAPTVAACSKPVTVGPHTPPTPGIHITKTVDGQSSETVMVGKNFVYQLVITNTGQTDLTNITVTDATPAGVTLISADKGDIANNNWSQTGLSLASGASETVNITAVVNTYVAGQLVNTACVTAPEVTPPTPGQPNECAHATVTVTPPTPAPTTLVNTGAGNVLGLFGLSAVIGTLGYRFFLGRRLSND